MASDFTTLLETIIMDPEGTSVAAVTAVAIHLGLFLTESLLVRCIQLSSMGHTRLQVIRHR